MKTRRLQNSHQRHKFLRAKASRDILKFTQSLGNGIFRVFKRYFPLWVSCCFIRIYVAQFKCFTDLNLFKYSFNVIQNWETDTLQFYSMVLFFSTQMVMVEGGKSSWLRMADLAGGFGPLLALIDGPAGSIQYMYMHVYGGRQLLFVKTT